MDEETQFTFFKDRKLVRRKFFVLSTTEYRLTR